MKQDFKKGDIVVSKTLKEVWLILEKTNGPLGIGGNVYKAKFMGALSPNAVTNLHKGKKYYINGDNYQLKLNKIDEYEKLMISGW